MQSNTGAGVHKVSDHVNLRRLLIIWLWAALTLLGKSCDFTEALQWRCRAFVAVESTQVLNREGAMEHR